MKRPAPTTMGAVLMLLRVLAGGLFIANAFANRSAFVSDVVLDGATSPADDRASINVIVDVLLAGYGVWLAFYLVLAWLVVRGVNWARIAAMLLATASILVSFVEWWQSGLEITLRTTLLSVALDILILLALSSQAARAFARIKHTALAEKELAQAGCASATRSAPLIEPVAPLTERVEI